ncbi:MAG: TonB-dependent receptor [Gemmatimonadaceae bacterium]
MSSPHRLLHRLLTGLPSMLASVLTVGNAVGLAVGVALGLAVAPTLASAQPTPAPAAASAAVASAAVGRITGIVLDQATKHPIADAQISVVGTTLAARTDSSGRFTVQRVPEGTVTLRIARLGYRLTVKSDLLVVPGRATQTVMELETAAAALSAVTVQGGGQSLAPPRQMPNSRVALSYAEIRRSPGAVGDVSRLVQALPGVVSGNDSRNDIIARGGSTIENLTLIDGIEVANINHFADQGTTGGPIGMINNELVRDATFMAGGFASKYGNRLSSVLDIGLREGTSDAWRSEFDLSTAGAGLITEGPLGRNTTLIASARQSYLDLLAPALGLTATPYTTNFQTKLAWHPSPRSTLAVVGLGGLDHITFKSTAADTADARPVGSTRFRGQRWIGGVTWHQLLGQRGSSTLVLSAATTTTQVETRETAVSATPVFDSDSRDTDLTARYELQWSIPGVAELSTGLSAKRLQLHSALQAPFGTQNPLLPTPGRVDPLQVTQSTATPLLGSWLELTRTIGAVDLVASARVDRYQARQAVRVSPRTSVTWHLTDALALSGTWGRYHQQVPLFITANIPANASLSPMRADQAIASLRWTPRSDLLLSVEGFDKRYADYPVSRDYPMLSLANTGDDFGIGAVTIPMVSRGTGRAKGVELFVQQKFTGRTYGQLSYTHSSVQHRALDGIWRRGAYDTPDLFTMILGAKSGLRREFSTRVSWGTGRPTTPLLSAVSAAQNRLVFDVSQLNADRAPNYFRMDLRFDNRLPIRGTWLSTYIELQNVTNRHNKTTLDWNPKTGRAQWREQTSFLPVGGINWKF